MTPAEANTLEQGDPVRISAAHNAHGRVLKTSPFTVWIQWKSGCVVCYHKDSMPHIERLPVATHDP